MNNKENEVENTNEEEIKEEVSEYVENNGDEPLQTSGFYGKSFEFHYETDSSKVVIPILVGIWLVCLVIGIIFFLKYLNKGETGSVIIVVLVFGFVTYCLAGMLFQNIKRNKEKKKTSSDR